MLLYMSVIVNDATYCKQKCNYSGNIVLDILYRVKKNVPHVKSQLSVCDLVLVLC